MKKGRKKSNKGKKLLFTVVLLFFIIYAGFLLKGKLSFFSGKIVAGTLTENGEDTINENISTNVPSNGDNIKNNANAHSNLNEFENNQDNKSQNDNNKKNNNYANNDSGKQPAENIDDVLVLVNKKRYLEPDYKPSDLVVPNVRFSFDGEHEKKYMRKEAAEALEELFGQASKENIYIFALSGYRSYNTQKWLFENEANRIGEEAANKLTARPGESEHQTGLAMDITSQSVQFGLKEKFGETKEGKWIKDNAYKFGFIIRYAKDKEDITGYSYEPWHIRYVGRKVAEEIYNKDIALEEYLTEG